MFLQQAANTVILFMEASRRVEILFRLKDEEMVREMMEVLSEDD